MKYFAYILMAGLLLISCKKNQSSEPQTVEVNMNAGHEKTKNLADASYAKAEFSIEGMTCAVGCAAKIEKNLASKTGISYAKVDFDKKLAMVAYDEKTITLEDLSATVNEVSDVYSVSNMKNVADFGLSASDESKPCGEGCKKDCCKGKDEAIKESCAKDCDKPCCSEKKDS